MEKALVLAAMLSCVAGLARGAAEGSAVPAGFAYQGVLSDPVTGPLTGEQTVTFRLFENATDENPLWETNQVVVCSAEGLFHAWLEGGVTMVEAFRKHDDGPFERYLELEVEGHGGAIAPRVEFTSVPQALLAQSVRQAVDGFTVGGDLAFATTNGVLQAGATGHFAKGATFKGLDVQGNATWTSNAELNVAGTLTAESFAGYGFAQPGFITMWQDADNIPAGWALCDGNNGTPDLRDRFLVGVYLDQTNPPYDTTTTYPYAAQGGMAQVELTVDQMPSHTHHYTATELPPLGRMNNDEFGDPEDCIQGSPQSGTCGQGEPHENRPPYYALCFIMKL